MSCSNLRDQGGFFGYPTTGIDYLKLFSAELPINGKHLRRKRGIGGMTGRVGSGVEIREQIKNPRGSFFGSKTGDRDSSPH
jgi:hypothetical protein